MKLLSSLVLLSAIAISSSQAATVCNGHAELCDRSYSTVSFIGAHDSFAVGDSLAANQDKDVTAQLNDGIRMLQMQAHNNNGSIHLCHSSCSLLDGGLMSEYLSKVTTWVASNPNEVLSLLLVNIDNLPATTFASAFESAGLSAYAYSPPSAQMGFTAWPTLGALIDAKTNVVAFLDNTASFADVPYLIDEFSNMFEDAYGVTDQTFGCAVNRTNGDPGSQLMLVNHYLDTVSDIFGTQAFLPDKTKLNETNAASGPGSIEAHVQNCQSLWGRAPNHILLDFYDSMGNAPFVYAAALNGVSAPTNEVTPGTIASASATGSASGSARAGSASVSSRPLGGAGRVEAGGVLGTALGVVALFFAL